MKLMIGICLLAALLSCTMAAITQSPPTTSQAAPVTINPKLRRALLEALSSFDGDDSTESDEETTTSSNLGDLDDVTNNPSFIKVHSFAVDGDKSDENEIIKTIIISRPRTTLTPPKPTSSDDVEINFGKTPDPINSVSINSQNIQQARSIETRLTLNGEKKEEKLAKKKATEKTVTKPITPAITTTTLPPPVTNADGENIEKVAKDDVKIFQAPLLAAFTVQQDVNGQPNKVISLFRNTQQHKLQPEVTTSRIINMEFRASQPEVFPAASTQVPVTTVQPQSNNAQLILNFEQRQRQLEEQIRVLQAKQREQEEIIKRHRDEQQNRFRTEQQNQYRTEQQQVQFRFNQPTQAAQSVQQVQNNQQVSQPATQALVAPPSPSVNVQFIPSIPLGHTVGISVEQQLPFKGPTEFNPDKPDFQKSFIQRQQQFQFQQFQQQQNLNQFNQNQQAPLASQLPTNLELPVRQAQEFNTFSSLPTNLELPHRPFQVFNSAPLAVLPSLTEIVPQSQNRNRVFRNDALQTGNFGVNIQRQQLVPLNQNFDNQLQNLLVQSGISPRSTEDFRIISKVLSLNHGIPNELLFNNNNSGKFF